VGVKRGHAWTTGLVLGLVAGITATGCGAKHTERSGDRPAAVPAASTMPGPQAAPTGQPTWSSAPPPGPSAGATPTGSTGPGPSATATGAPTLPAACEEVLTAAEVDRALGRRLGGDTRFIKGVAEPRISRTGRVTCRYGVGSAAGRGTSPTSCPQGRARCAAAAAVPVELSLSTYGEPEAASQRVDLTMHQEQTRGAHQSRLRVLDKPAVLLSGGQGDPLLVMADGDLTLALSVARGLVPADRTGGVLTALAEAVLRHLY
jgi:hypothetical protein